MLKCSQRGGTEPAEERYYWARHAEVRGRHSREISDRDVRTEMAPQRGYLQSIHP